MNELLRKEILEGQGREREGMEKRENSICFSESSTLVRALNTTFQQNPFV
jgi:hypothetical protein